MDFRKGYVSYEGTQKDTFLSDIKRKGVLQQVCPRGFGIYKYDPERFPFEKTIRSTLDRVAPESSAVPLAEIHTILDSEQSTLTVDGTPITQALYSLGLDFQSLYRDFLRNVVARSIFGQKVFFQRIPHFRLNVPHMRGSAWQGERLYHVDLATGHPPQEINIWVPLTDAHGSAAIVCADIESSLGLFETTDFDFIEFGRRLESGREMYDACTKITEQVEVNFGEFLVFDSRCIHATQINRTDNSRISFDTRIIIESEFRDFDDIYRSTGPMRSRFVPGDFFADAPL